MERKNVIREIILTCYNCNLDLAHSLPTMSSIESRTVSAGECPHCACDFEVSLTRGRAGHSFVTKMQVVFKV